jgi:hypothetical protein
LVAAITISLSVLAMHQLAVNHLFVALVFCPACWR